MRRSTSVLKIITAPGSRNKENKIKTANKANMNKSTRERERDRERERQRETDRQTDRDRETETDTERQTETDRQIDRQKHRDRQTDRQTDREFLFKCLEIILTSVCLGVTLAFMSELALMTCAPG